ncbi:MAG: hypothetical protein Q8L21_01490 [Candidatus Komeilibacteria bacterium]|nr:hypothetical protein [Candidatus Komeilibacteria bacterium]
MLNIPIQTSQDVLFLALALAAILVAVFLCLALYYLILNLRDIHVVTRDIRQRVEKFWEVIELLREKLQIGGAVFTLAARGIKELAEYAKGWNESLAKKKTRKKKEVSE